MKVASLVLTDQNNAIGKNHIVLNYLPAYIQYFNDLTGGAPIIMGRRTFESIGHFLNSKKNIVITRNEKYHSTKARTFTNLKDALHHLKSEKKVFVVGGVELFKESLPLTSEIYRTTIRARFKSEEYYPEIDTSEFELTTSECINRNEENRFDYCVEKWVRNN